MAATVEKSKFPGLTLEGREIKCLLYAAYLLCVPTDEELHESLLILEHYCKSWNCPVNIGKSKVMIFLGGKKHSKGYKYNFTIEGDFVCQVTNYNYLGLTVQFEFAIKDLSGKARKSYYYYRLWLKIFSVIKPILLYESEIQGTTYHTNYELWDKSPIETFHLELCKSVLRVHRNACNLSRRADFLS